MKKIKIPRSLISIVLSSIAVVIALGGTAVAFSLGRNSVHSRQIAPGAVQAGDLGQLSLRSGSLVDTDTTAGDGSYNYASGHARCKPGERLISGGLRLRPAGGGVFPGQRASLVESGPIPKRSEWAVAMNSDLGGAARKDFVVFAYCLTR